MILSEKQQEVFNGFLSSHDIKAECPACGSVKSEPAQFVAVVPFDPIKRNVIKGTLTPLVHVLCEACGYSRFFVAKKTGLLP